jgi:rhodanese-related sulfurtransferase
MSALHKSLAAAAAMLAIGAGVAGAPRVEANDDARISAIELARSIADGAELDVYDLRDAASFEMLHIPGSSNVTADLVRAGDGSRARDIVLVDAVGPRAADAQQRLRAEGFTHARYLDGGMSEWIARVLEPRLAVDATPEETRVFEEAAELSRFFGGTPRAGVARSGIAPRTPSTDTMAVVNASEQVRRRGCE